jgi:hypothetical protein
MPCRWLLLSLDRLTANQLVMTHELIASMLGGRREGITDAAGRLQAASPREDACRRLTQGRGPWATCCPC